MEDQKLQSLPPTLVGEKIPDEWKEKFLIKRIDEDDIEISLEQRDGILQALNKGQRFVQVGKFTLMLNSIKSIDPKWGEKNIPPRPSENIETVFDGQKAIVDIINTKEIEMWDKLYGRES